MSIIAAGTTTTTALSSTGNTDGTLQLQVNGTTPSVTLNALGAVGVGSSPSYGSSGQVLISGGSTTAPTWGTAGTSTTATNLAGGSNGTIPYQSASGTTQMLAVGTSGQVLQTNGAGAPSWVTLSAAGSITATASGSIASGNPVLVNTDGTVSAPTTTLGPASLGAQTSAISEGASFYSMVYCTVPGVYVMFYANTANTYLSGRIGTPASDGAISWGSEVVLGSSTIAGHCAAVYLSSDPGKCAVYFTGGGGNAGRIQVVSVTATALTTGGAASVGRSDNYGGIAWDPVNQVGMVNGVDGSTGRVFNCAFTVGGLTPTAGAPVSSTNGAEPNIEYDRNSGYFLTACRALSNTACIQPATTTTGRVVTQYTMTTVATVGGTASGVYGMVYVPGPNKMLVTAMENYNTVVYIYVTMTGSTPSAATVLADTSLTTSGQQKALGLDAVNNVVVSNFRNSSGYSAVKCFPVNGTTISLGSVVQIDTINNLVCGISGKLPFDSVNGRNASYYGGGNIYAKTFKAATSTLTSENFIGFSTASYTNGQTAVVTVVGGKSTTVSGVSVGVKNYVAGTALTTSVTPNYAGIGLSSTSLLVKG